MYRRLISTKTVKCSNCKLYNKGVKLCKLNLNHALSNRLDEKICGIDGKQYWELDKTNLILSIDSKIASGIFLFTGSMSLIPLYSFTSYECGVFSILCFAGSYACSNSSTEYYQQYLDDNFIDIKK